MDPAALVHLVTEPTRYQVLMLLHQAPRTVNEIVDLVDGEQSNISHHLRTLRDAGIVRVQAEGRHRRYRLADAQVAAALEDLGSLAARLERLAFASEVGLHDVAAFHGYG